MAATTGYQAGLESSDTLLSYGIEATWGTPPASAFQAIRYTGETLAGSKSRSRPAEINISGEASSAVTQSETAAGAINFALSYGTYDDFFSVVLANDWGTTITLAGVAGDIALTNVSATVANLVSTTTNKFQNIVQGQWIRLLGFTNAINNNFYYVATKTDSTHLVLTTPFGPTVTETPGTTLAQVRGCILTNGTQFKSLSVQQKFSSNMFLRYPGLFVTGMQLGAQVGQFISGSFTCVAQSESSATTDQSTGAVTAAPTGRVHDAVAGIGGILRNEVAIAATIDTFSLSVTRDGSVAQYGLGSASAQGIVRGTTTVTGTLKLYFKTFTEYALFKAETQSRIELITKDAAGNAYIITLQAGSIMNPGVSSAGPNQPVTATFTLEGNPQAAGGTIQIDRLPAT